MNEVYNGLPKGSYGSQMPQGSGVEGNKHVFLKNIKETTLDL